MKAWIFYEFISYFLGKSATSYALSPKGKQSDGKSKIKPAPIEVIAVSGAYVTYKNLPWLTGLIS